MEAAERGARRGEGAVVLAASKLRLGMTARAMVLEERKGEGCCRSRGRNLRRVLREVLRTVTGASISREEKVGRAFFGEGRLRLASERGPGDLSRLLREILSEAVMGVSRLRGAAGTSPSEVSKEGAS